MIRRVTEKHLLEIIAGEGYPDFATGRPMFPMFHQASGSISQEVEMLKICVREDSV
jgi:hypothetical protein